MDLEGNVLASLTRPNLDVYQEGMYSPTWVAVNEERHGGNGDVWVADGYGQSYVHRYDKSGNYISSINGEREGLVGLAAPTQSSSTGAAHLMNCMWQ
ncbi:MAG: hypothetical protein OSB07_08555, partial [Dehalococcoidia bacterium]|nr:hypothetical protein [Dehalococcoidia bacterium]